MVCLPSSVTNFQRRTWMGLLVLARRVLKRAWKVKIKVLFGRLPDAFCESSQFFTKLATMVKYFMKKMQRISQRSKPSSYERSSPRREWQRKLERYGEWERKRERERECERERVRKGWEGKEVGGSFAKATASAANENRNSPKNFENREIKTK